VNGFVSSIFCLLNFFITVVFFLTIFKIFSIINVLHIFVLWLIRAFCYNRELVKSKLSFWISPYPTSK